MKNTNLTRFMMVGSLALFLFCGITAYLLPHIPLVWQITGALAIVTAIGYVVMERQELKVSLSKKTTQYGLNSLVMSLLALGIVVFINMIALKYDVKKDFTKNKLHTLSDQTVKIVKGLKMPVTFKAFISPTQMQDFDRLFGKYTYFTDKIKKEFVDLDKDPFAVQRYNIKQPGTIVIESQNRSARVENLQGPDDPKAEEKLTNAIIQVEKGDKKKICFSTGHGERLLSDSSREGYSDMKEALENSRYKTEEVLLVDKDKVPADCEIFVVAAPKSDFMEGEVKNLENYLHGGGKVMVMVEPTGSIAMKGFLAKYGVDWHPGKTVLETNRLQQLAGGNPLTPIVTNYDTTQEITQEAKQMSIFPIATPIEKAATSPAGMKVASLFSTSSRSLEVELQGDKVKVNEKVDRKGPISLAVAVSGKAEAAKPAAPTEEAKKDEKKDPKGEPAKDQEFRLVVVGDSDFASNGVRKFGINADLFQNMLSWLSKEEDLISIRPRPTDTSEFEITDERAKIINLASMLLAPAALFATGIAVWLSRRRK